MKNFCKCIISVIIILAYCFESIAWACPDNFCLSVQSVFKPLDKRSIKDMGILKYYLICLSKNYSGIKNIKEDVNFKMEAAGLDIALKFSEKNKSGYEDMIVSSDTDLIIPCRIGNRLYFSYLSVSSDNSIENISVFSPPEIKKMKERALLFHPEREDARDIDHECFYDTPLSVIHAQASGIEKVPDDVTGEVVDFFLFLCRGGNTAFMNDLAGFFKSGAATLVPRETSVTLNIDGMDYEIPFEFEGAHASNSYVNIPKNVYEDIAAVLVHEIGSKCGRTHEQNDRLEEAYVFWKNMAKDTSDAYTEFIRDFPELEYEAPRMCFVDISAIKERDYRSDAFWDLQFAGPDQVGTGIPAEEKNKEYRVPVKSLLWVNAAMMPVILSALVLSMKTFYGLLTADSSSRLIQLAIIVGGSVAILGGAFQIHEWSHMRAAKLFLGEENVGNKKYYFVEMFFSEEHRWKNIIVLAAGPLVEMLFGGMILAAGFALNSAGIKLIPLVFITPGLIIFVDVLFAFMPIWKGFLSEDTDTDGYQILREILLIREEKKNASQEESFFESAHKNLKGAIGGYHTGAGTDAEDIYGLYNMARDKRKTMAPALYRKGEAAVNKGKTDLTVKNEGPGNGKRGKTVSESVSGKKTQLREIVQGYRMSLRDSVLSLERGEKMLIAIDETLHTPAAEIHIAQLIKGICAGLGMKGDRLLKNVVFIKGRGEKLVRKVNRYNTCGVRRVKIKAENTVFITKAENRALCLGLDKNPQVTFVDDSALDLLGYYPLMEIIYFSLFKRLCSKGIAKYNEETVIALYRSLAFDIGRKPADIINDRTVLLKLKPVEKYNLQELKYLYKAITTFLKAA
ncbi:MAG: hypothetical protein ABH883_06115 [Candidatus Omnitrophota bacterium]